MLLFGGYRQGFLYICLILFCWYAAHPRAVEARLFVNEFFSLIGFVIFLFNPVIYKKNDYIYNCILSLLVIFFAYAILSILIFKDFYGYLRNSVLVYSIFSFFLGIRLFDVLSHIGKLDIFFLSALFPSPEFYRTSYSVLIPLYLSRYSKTFKTMILLIIIGIMFVVKLYYGGSTSIAIILFIVFITMLNKRNITITVCLSIVLVILFSIYIKPYLELLLKDGILMRHIMEMDAFFTFDGNATTRFFLWSYVFYEVFLENIFGIGLGTPLFSVDFIYNHLQMWDPFKNDEYVVYTLGSHNSFLTVLARFGVIGLMPFIILYWKLIRDFINEKYNIGRNRVFFFYYAFFIVTANSLLNVVLESPLQASLYWITLGLLYKAKRVCNTAIGHES